jgi:Flp pilus assembly protein TadG
MHRHEPAASDERGAAAVEFALVLLPTLLLLFGMIQYGLYFWAMQGGTDAARTAGRLAAVGKPADCATFRSDVRDQLGKFGDGPTATVTRVYEKSDPTQVQVGDKVTVHIRFRSIDLNFPFVPFIDGGWVDQTVETRVEYVPDQPVDCT